jgi:hypothetical protein
MTLPAGRKLIFAIEDDGPAGAAATLAQLSALADMGHDIAVAWPWPERRGDKSDLADVGLAFGAPAVAARIAAAEPLRPLPSSRRSLLPAFYPGPVEPREAALARQKEVIDRTIADGAALAVLRRRMTARRAELLADIAEPSPAEKGAATRQASLEVAGGPIAKPPRALITGVQGSGKTASAVAAAASIRDPLAVWITAPRLDLALEVAADYRRVAQPDSLPVRVVRGRSAPDPARPGQTMCERAAAAGVVAAAGLSVRAKLCPTCPARDRCGYLQQAAAIGTMGGRGVFVMATPYLFLPSPAPAPDLLIVDEDCVMPAIEVTSLALADLAAYAVSGISADSWAGIDAVRVALLASRPLEAMRATGIGRTGIAAMRAAFHARLDQLVPSLDGGMPDDAIIAACDAPDRRRIGGLLRLLSAIGRELEQPRKTFNAITVRGETITISRLRKPHGVKKAAALLLDGTGDPALAGQLFGRRLVHHRVAIERLAHVTGTKGKAYSRQSITGLDRHGQPRSEDRSAEAAKLRADIQAVARQMPGAPLIVASKAALEALELPDDAPQAHFGALRGLNCWDKVRAAVIVGRESVAIDHLEQLARAFLARDPQPFLAAARFATATRMRRMRGGGLEPVKVEVHPDPRVQRVLEQIREAEIVQAVDRLRPLWNRREFALLNHLCIDVTYDRIRGHTELVAGGTPLEKTYLAKGLLPFGARDLHSLMPALFATRKAAERALAKNPLLPNKDPLWTGGVFLYRLQGQRGRSSRALIDLTRHADPRATLEAAFGPLAAFRALEQPTDAIRTPVRPAADPLVPFSPWFASPATSTWRSDRPPDG